MLDKSLVSVLQFQMECYRGRATTQGQSTHFAYRNLQVQSLACLAKGSQLESDLMYQSLMSPCLSELPGLTQMYQSSDSVSRLSREGYGWVGAFV